LSSWAKVKEGFPDINIAPVAADAFINSLRFIPFDISATSFLVFYLNYLQEYEFGLKELYEEKQNLKASRGVKVSRGSSKMSPFVNSISYPTPKGQELKRFFFQEIKFMVKIS
jgi:hypothetical protein